MRKCSKPDGNKNWVGKRIAELRQERGMSQNDLAIQLQKCGLDVDKNAIQLLEHGHRYVRDMELFLIAKILKVRMEDLFVDVRIHQGEILGGASLRIKGFNFNFQAL